MKMPWKREPTDPLDTPSGRALAQSEEGLAEAQAQWPEVHRLESSLNEFQRKNHFGERIAQLMRGDL